MREDIASYKPEAAVKRSLHIRIFTNLTFWVLIAIIAGVLLGSLAPATGVKMEIIGKTFIDIIKLFIAPIIFLTIVLGISGMDDLKKVGRIGVKSLLYFEVVSTISLAAGVLMALLIKPGKIDKSSLQIENASKYTSGAAKSFDWLSFFLNNITLQVLVAAIIIGVLLNYSKYRLAVIRGLGKLSKLVFKALKYVMYLAPLGAFGGMAYTVGKFGLHTLVPLAKLMGTVYLTMAVFIFLVLGGILKYYKMSILRFLKYIREELLLVLGTSSSESALPSIMLKLEKMGCSKSVVGLVVPTGYSFNLDGTSIYLSMSVIFIAQLYDVHLTIGEILTIIGILMVTSKGAAGVTGSGFIVLASTLTAIHKIPVEGLAFLLGVDKFMSEARAITNIIGNGVATIVIAKSEKEFHPPADDAVAYTGETY
ncbi:cation:dicarboxylase symporter family transporter [Chitinophaga ginsengisegetis]|uniref:cation:dicarboxylate symporter family transporter n=1 Tax=Chitinophaga ginsengisegetis TaxID=393003 RepID=UPI000DBA67F9|nr:cation:dicarboxylase symporter family transporter [Chitinophaga ginsengisegetis]MDR6568109.1 aerobic C4-dicarboxylate transport protein [Chitinophaga ginsengisegetis]MDR6647336.1 aerobic C4-dicarboxylate transport protein [Chitinophaga ginsengisegetis]MDR6653685.1 aerobic C4-dicarboxylate transport protein [Chitinophaga ginsengisegetis]